MDRFFQLLLMFSTAGLSWLSMMALHECGHVLHGWMSSARLGGVHLPLIGFSRTDFVENPHPLFVVWGGPLWGCLLPLMIWGAVRCIRAPCGFARGATDGRGFLLKWFTGFCLIVNGAYLFGGAYVQRLEADDPSVILQNGGARWQLIAFGLPAIAAGLYLWNGLGPHFNLGAARGKVDCKAAVGAAVALTCVVLLLLIYNH
jgi:hypothetical protein